MKKIFFAFFVLVMATTAVNAQGYKTGLGLGLDFGEGKTMVGPTVKYFFNEKGAIEGDLLFGGGSTMVSVFYQHHGNIADAGGLKYYLGGGPSIELVKGGSSFVALRPMAGLDYKVAQAPLAISFDWRPALWFYSGDTDFQPGRFGMGFKFVLGKN